MSHHDFIKAIALRWQGLTQGQAANRDGGSWRLYATVSTCTVFASCIAVASAHLSQQSSGGGRIAAIDSELCDDMKARHVLSDGPVPCSRLSLVRFRYLDFDGKLQDDGEIVVLDAVASHVLNIFNTLRRNGFPVAKSKLMNGYDGNDDASMDDNNTSAFNDRKITGGGSISLHAYGLAIDINPVQNPYVKRSNGGVTVSPKAGAAYVNRAVKHQGATEAIVDIFAENGFFIWGGSWHDPIDYQHFQVGRKTAERLAAAPPAQAQSIFSQMVERYQACWQASADKDQTTRKKCIAVADPRSA
jgi:D-alanyl-D-alanine carboxypeptidase